MTSLIYKGKSKSVYIYAKLMNMNLASRLKQIGGAIFLMLYYAFASHLPSSYSPLVEGYLMRSESFAVAEYLSFVVRK